MRKWWPKTLFGRNLLLLISLVLIAQVSTISAYMLVQRPRVIEFAQLVANQVNALNVAMTRIPPDQRDALIGQMNQSGSMRIQRVRPPIHRDDEPALPFVQLFMRHLRASLAPDADLLMTSEPQPSIWVRVNISGERYWMMLPVNTMLRYGWLSSALMLSLCMALSSAVGALIIQRRINRPLRDIASAAENLGEGGRPERLPSYPVTELAGVAEQFNTMMDKLDSMEASRALMLAGISHDIRTPLTKLRLALAMNAQANAASMTKYIDQIDLIVGQFVDFGRTGSDEPTGLVDLNLVVTRLAEHLAERGHHFALRLGALPPHHLRPIATMRLVSNLMENAVKYGVVGLEVQTDYDGLAIVLCVRDSGPGIAAGDERRLLQPFVRADTGRSQVSGSGLGLAIADRIARLDGGQLTLARRTPHGLEARVRWLLAPTKAQGPVIG